MTYWAPISCNKVLINVGPLPPNVMIPVIGVEWRTVRPVRAKLVQVEIICLLTSRSASAN